MSQSSLANHLPGRSTPMPVPAEHFVNGHPLTGPWPDGIETLVVAMGCFWGAERPFWSRPGVYSTAVGYAGGSTPNPTYEETCTSMTGHTEAVLMVGSGDIATEIAPLDTFYYAEDYHQQYLAKNPAGYCNHGFCQVTYA